MKRREFLSRTTAGVGAAWLGSWSLASALTTATTFSATDIVTLGSTGIKTSRLAMGTGTVGSNHHSNQTALGIQGLADLLHHGYDHGLRFFDVADSYGSHPHAREALKRIPRDKVTILTKSWARDYDGMKADIVRFLKELDTDYLDIAFRAGFHVATPSRSSTLLKSGRATDGQSARRPPRVAGCRVRGFWRAAATDSCWG